MMLRNGASPVPEPIRQALRPSLKLSDTSLPVAWMEINRILGCMWLILDTVDVILDSRLI